MRNRYQGHSSPAFVARLSTMERSLYESFSSHQRISEADTFCVFQSAFGTEINFMSAPRNAPLSEHIDRNMEQDSNRYNILLMALDLNRSFESQWPYAPGRFEHLDRFVDHPLIQTRGLDTSRFLDQKSAEGSGLRRSFMSIVSSTSEPSIEPQQTQRAKLTLLQGGRAIPKHT